jgi:hypothetical protein
MYILTRRVVWALLVVLFFGASLISALAIPSMARLGDAPLALERNPPAQQTTLSPSTSQPDVEDYWRTIRKAQDRSSLPNDAPLYYGHLP